MTPHRCGTHTTYRLTCEGFDALRARSQGTCERCGEGGHRLEIDHDHALGISAVRGLVCGPCNRHLARVDAGTVPSDADDLAYVGSAWHIGRVTTHTPDRRTPIQYFRCEEDLWRAGMRVAESRGTNLGAELRRFLEWYTAGVPVDAESDEQP